MVRGRERARERARERERVRARENEIERGKERQDTDLVPSPLMIKCQRLPSHLLHTTYPHPFPMLSLLLRLLCFNVLGFYFQSALGWISPRIRLDCCLFLQHPIPRMGYSIFLFEHCMTRWWRERSAFQAGCGWNTYDRNPSREEATINDTCFSVSTSSTSQHSKILVRIPEESSCQASHHRLSLEGYAMYVNTGLVLLSCFLFFFSVSRGCGNQTGRAVHGHNNTIKRLLCPHNLCHIVTRPRRHVCTSRGRRW